MKRLTDTLILNLSWCLICLSCSGDPSRGVRSHFDDKGLAGAETAGSELAGAETAGSELAGAETAGAETAGSELAGAETAGSEQAGAETAGEELAGEELSCSSYGSPTTYSELATDELAELSGLTPSGRSPDVFWAHNDSGNEPTLYAIHTNGALIATLELPIPNPELADLEDIDTAPCPRRASEVCLWVADTGDNAERRDDVRVFIIPEPSLERSLMIDEPHSPHDTERLALDESELITLRFTYDEGPADVEALVVEPDGEALWLFEKVEERDARVWRHAIELEVIMADPTPPRTTLSAVTRFASPGVPINRGRLITAADLSPDALSLAVRVYTGVYVYHLPTPSLISALPQLTPELIRLGPLTEPQGEALCYDKRGALWSASEVTADTEGEPQVLTRQECID